MRYSQHPGEVHYSISRALLNCLLIEAAAAVAGVEFEFGCRCIDADPASGRIRLRDAAGGAEREFERQLLIGADGAGSAVRAALQRRGLCQATEDPLDHDYKEIEIPARDGRPQLQLQALHVWPRGGFMLIALPNADGSFTATLFLAAQRPDQLRVAGNDAAVRAFFEREFPERAATGAGSGAASSRHIRKDGWRRLHCWPWHAGATLLVGDAAHAIVPFHGQGLNCGFEDCVLLDALLAGTAAISGHSPHSSASACRTPTRSPRWRSRIIWRCVTRCATRCSPSARRSPSALS